MTNFPNIKPEQCATITIDCLNTFMEDSGLLSISQFQKQVHNLSLEKVQNDLIGVKKTIGELRRMLFEYKVPQIQFQDAHVIETIHGKRFHSFEIIREGEEPDFLRTYPPHALLDKHRKFGTDDQQPSQEIHIPGSDMVHIRWFDSKMPNNARVDPKTELVFYKDDFSMSPGTPFLYQLLWELRRQGRFYLIVMGVCDEICNLRNILVLLAAVFNVIYVQDGTYPLNPDKREKAIDYMKGFNFLGHQAAQFITVSAEDVIQYFSRL
jgi:nicotinamidase-related amidase